MSAAACALSEFGYSIKALFLETSMRILFSAPIWESSEFGFKGGIPRFLISMLKAPSRGFAPNHSTFTIPLSASFARLLAIRFAASASAILISCGSIIWASMRPSETSAAPIAQSGVKAKDKIATMLC